jgi:hypothetical protein
MDNTMSKQSIPTVWKPTPTETEKLVQGSCEVSALKLAAGGGAAVVSIYDAKNSIEANENALRWVLDASTTDNDAQSFCAPLVFKKGVYAKCEQGEGQNSILCVAAINYLAN